jgi:hypothetical protein
LDAIQFTQFGKEDPQLNSLLSEVAIEAGDQVEFDDTQRYAVTGVDILVAIAAYALYRFLKDFFDYRRGLNEVELLRKQEEVISALIEDGFPPEQAKAVTVALLKQISKRGADDPAIKAAASILGLGS